MKRCSHPNRHALHAYKIKQGRIVILNLKADLNRFNNAFAQLIE
ncbi:MAG: hypothetical protein WCH37_09790 [Synechococcaceae cyanobacterium ELA182]